MTPQIRGRMTPTTSWSTHKLFRIPSWSHDLGSTPLMYSLTDTATLSPLSEFSSLSLWDWFSCFKFSLSVDSEVFADEESLSLLNSNRNRHSQSASSCHNASSGWKTNQVNIYIQLFYLGKMQIMIYDELFYPC